jgi:hypothetical protein
MLTEQSYQELGQSQLQLKTEVNCEVRAHLNAILGFSQLLQSNNKEPLSENQTEWVSHIYQAGKLLAALITEAVEACDSSKNCQIKMISGRFTQDLQDELSLINKRLDEMNSRRLTAIQLFNCYQVDLI